MSRDEGARLKRRSVRTRGGTFAVHQRAPRQDTPGPWRETTPHGLRRDSDAPQHKHRSTRLHATRTETERSCCALAPSLLSPDACCRRARPPSDEILFGPCDVTLQACTQKYSFTLRDAALWVTSSRAVFLLQQCSSVFQQIR